MHVIGHAKVSEAPGARTSCPWGDVSEIAGKELPVFDRNRRGDCLCLVHGKGLVDVSHADVAAFRIAEEFDPVAQLRQWAEAWLFRRVES
jgi:hypothetical protein